MKKTVSLFLTVIMSFSLFIFAGAEGAKTDTFKMASLNVAGLPDFSAFQGGEVDMESVMSFINNKTMNNQTVIGRYINARDYEIFAVQEDFFYHDFLASELSDYKYSTQWKGGVPWGDGTSVFTKTSPLTGEEHIKWNTLSGDGSEQDGADVYSRKGITYVCVEIEEGVYIDVYNIHTDAFDDPGSTAARKDNFRQLADLIDSKNTGRPVIITGDFNISSHHKGNESAEYLTSRLIKEEGFKDAWTELYNGGDYDDYSAWHSQGAYWGSWDSVEKFLYRDGENVKITCDSVSYVKDIVNENGEAVSDHAMIEGEFTYTVTGGADSGEKPSKTENPLEALFRKILSFFDALFSGLSNIDNIFANLFG